MKTKSIWLYIVILNLMLAALACTLASEAPATLAPSTPLSTITPESGIIPSTLVQPSPQPFQITPPAGGAVAPQSTPVQIMRPTIMDQVDASRMMLDINNLVSFETRHVASTSSSNKGINAAYNYIVGEFQKIKASSPYPDIQIDIFPHQFNMVWSGKDLSPSNIIMSITGTDAAAGVVMITAHYDTALRDWFNGDGYQPGANDNGSGVAATIELARVLSQQRHRATIVFVLFAAEETQRMGSKFFVSEYLLEERIPVIGVINMDIIGNPNGRRGERYDYDMRVYSQGPNNGSNSRFLARMVDYAASRYLPEMNVNVEDALDRSGRWGDHESFSEVGYAAVRFIEQADDATVAHTPRDTIDNIDANYLRRNTQVALATILLLADGPNAPSLKPLRASSTDPSSLVLEWSYNPFCASYVIALRRPGSLVYDEYYTVDGSSLSVSSGLFKNYEAVTVGCIDQNGLIGRLAPELLVPVEAASQ